MISNLIYGWHKVRYLYVMFMLSHLAHPLIINVIIIIVCSISNAATRGYKPVTYCVGPKPNTEGCVRKGV